MRFSQAHHNIFVEELTPNKISITVINEQTKQFFHLKEYQFQKITIKVFEKAFDPKIQNILCVLLQQKDQIILNFQLNIEFLPTINETIVIQAIKESSNYRLKSLNCQISQYNQAIDSFEQNSFLTDEFKGECGSENIKYKKILKKGTYIIELFAIVYGYDGRADNIVQESEILMIFNEQKWKQSVTVELRIISNNGTHKIKSNYNVNTYQGFQMPITFIDQIVISSESHLQLYFLSSFNLMTITTGNIYLTKIQ